MFYNLNKVYWPDVYSRIKMFRKIWVTFLFLECWNSWVSDQWMSYEVNWRRWKDANMEKVDIPPLPQDFLGWFKGHTLNTKWLIFKYVYQIKSQNHVIFSFKNNLIYLYFMLNAIKENFKTMDEVKESKFTCNLQPRNNHR